MRDPEPPRVAAAADLVSLATPDPDAEPGELRSVRIASESLAPNAPSLDWMDVTADSMDAAGIDLADSSLTDVIVRGGSWANVMLRASNLRRVTFESTRLTGAILAESKLRSVRFVDCILDLANLRGAQFERASFEQCVLREADLQGAQLREVRFEGCTLDGAELSGMVCTDCIIQATTLENARGLLSLKGVAMPWHEIIDLAAPLAAAIGLRVLEE